MTPEEMRQADQRRDQLRRMSYFEIIAAVLAIQATEAHRMIRNPGPFDDAEDEQHDEILLAAARRFVECRADVTLPAYLTR